MNRVLLIIGGLLVGLLAATFFVPMFIDWTRYRGAFEEEASRILGRQVRVSGNVNLQLLPTPFIRFENVRVSDSQASVGEPLFKADDFTVWLSVGPLFAGTLEATQVELRKPVLTLVMNEKGGGNWEAIRGSGAAPAAPYVGSNVKLDTLRITNGSILLFGPNGDERTRFERINGELSADSLAGPYRISGAFASQGRAREVRLATAAPSEDGSFRLKGAVRVPHSGLSVTVDGLVRDLLAAPRLEGEVTARLPLPAEVPPAGTNTQAPNADKGAADSMIELRSSLKADTAGMELADIALSLELDGRPQLASWKTRVIWRERTDVAIDIGSRWLDLDRIAGKAKGTSPLPVLEQLASSLEDLLPAGGRTTLRVNVDQAGIGGDVASRVILVVDRSPEGLALRSLSAALPGGGRIGAAGKLTNAGGQTVFEGDVRLRAASLSRFLGWALQEPPSTSRRDGPFSIEGQVRIGSDGISGKGLALQVAGSDLRGDVSYRSGAKGQVVLALEGPEIDVTSLLDGASGPVGALKALSRKVEDTASAGHGSASALSSAHVELRLRVGRLLAGNVTLRDVVTDVRLADGHLAMPLVKFGAEDDWSFEIRGDVTDIARASAKGAMSLAVTADTPQGLAELASVLELPEAYRPSDQRTAALLPLRLAARVSVGGKGQRRHELLVDGTAAGGQVSGTVVVDMAGASWAEQRVDAAFSVASTDTERLIRAALPSTTSFAPTTSPAAQHPGRLTLRSIGTPRSGLTSIAAIETASGTAELRGRIQLDPENRLTADGDLRLDISDVGQIARIATGKSRPALLGARAVGATRIALRDGSLNLEATRLVLGDAEVSGRLELKPGAGSSDPWHVGGEIRTSRLSLPHAFALLTEDRGYRPPRPVGTSADKSVWSDDGFENGLLTAAAGALRIDAAEMEIAPGLPVRAAKLGLSGTAGRWDLRLEKSDALGGSLTAALNLQAMQAGLRLSGQTRLAQARLEAIAGASNPPAIAAGLVDLRLDLDGTGLSPRGLVTALTGKGQLALSDFTLQRLSPDVVRRSVGALIESKGELPKGQARNQLEQIVLSPHAPFNAGNRTLGVTIGEGTFRIARLQLDLPDGRVTGDTSIDTDTLRVDSEWRIDAKAPSSASAAPAASSTAVPRGATRIRGDLAPMTVVLTGPVADLAQVVPRIDTEALEQDIMVRKVERDVEELERLRREDEERAQREAARLRALEAERERLERERQSIAVPPAPGSPPSRPGSIIFPSPPQQQGPGPGSASPGSVQRETLPPPVERPAPASSQRSPTRVPLEEPSRPRP
ncbi:MAG TPA: AsmA family protein [Hyphomicrobiaceae bacterium]|nr:AsmA family protein [Hyphomicrobiaceae bacterium]